MVTKIKNLRQAMEFSSNFEWDVDGSSGLTFRYFDGTCIKLDGTLQEITGTGITFPGSGAYYVYVDLAETTPIVKTELAITSGNHVALYLVTNNGAAITNVEDLRSWTAAAIGADLLGAGAGAGSPQTSFDDLVDGYSPTLHYKFDQARDTNDIVNQGSAGSDWDVSLLNPASQDDYKQMYAQITGGDVEGSLSMPGPIWQKSATLTSWGYRVDTSAFTTTQWATALGANGDTGTGTWICTVAYGYDQNSDNTTLFEFDNTDTVQTGEFKWGMFNDNLDIDFFADPGTLGDWQVQSTSGINQHTTWPTFQLICLVQPSDGGGPLLYIDGVEGGNYTGVGVGEEDYWYDNWTSTFPTSFNLGCGYSAATTSSAQFAGLMDTVAYTKTALTGANISALWSAYSGL